MSRLLIAMSAAAALVVLDACPDDSQRTCEPGASQLCYCSDGQTSNQTCRDDGSDWAACRCAAHADAGTTDAAAIDRAPAVDHAVPADGASDAVVADRLAGEAGQADHATADHATADHASADSAAADSATSDAGGPVPAIQVQPADCRFGAIGVGATGYCEVAVVNAGEGVLTLGAITVSDPAGGVFQLIAAPAIGTRLPRAAARTIRVAATPRQISDTVIHGALDIASDDPAQPHLAAGLQARGNSGPTAVARVKSINGGAVSDISSTPLHLLPLDDVVLTGLDSVASSGRAIASYSWQIIQQPVGSTVVFTTPDAAETGFTFSSSGIARAGLDAVGAYNVVLNVFDDLGTASSNNARLILVVSPSAGLLVQLTWDHASADIDLHLLRAGGSPFTADDCYFGNCKSGMNLDWGGGDQNPLLWLDDIDGYGPELLRLPTPGETNYRVAVHYYSPFSSSIATTARVAIYADGGLVAVRSRLLDTCNLFWDVGDLAWPAATFTAIDTTRQETHGVCP